MVSVSEALIRVGQGLLGLSGAFISALSFECCLTRLKCPNGGGVIIVRTLLSGVVIFLAILAFRLILDTGPNSELSFSNLRSEVANKIPWFGAIFAAVYTGLYARFASQWKYLAHVYNQIKSVEVSSPVNLNALNQWKAGFIEDAEDLHLATKPCFASVIKAWSENQSVQEAFIEHAPRGRERLKSLLRQVELACDPR